MRLLVHDFSGHPFQAELARALADRGHTVLHVQCTSYASGKGSFGDGGDGNPQYVSIALRQAFEKYRMPRRLADELAYARRFVRVARRFRPDVVISCNDPLAAKSYFGAWAAVRRVRWVYWLQDVYSVAMSREAERRSRLGPAIGALFRGIERRLLRSADAVVAITADFDEILDAWDVPRSRRTVIENWAPLDEMPVRERDNPWRARQGLGSGFVYLYAGTLGLKHDPDILSTLANDDPDADVVVISEGLGADRLRAAASELSLPNLKVLAFQPWEELPEVLGAADVLVVLLEADAGTFSVPSKILTYLCAGRPILASMPTSNLGARTIEAAQAGLVVPPGEHEGIRQAARQLRRDQDLRQRMGRAGREHAEAAFDIVKITDRFDLVIRQVVGDTTGENS